MKINKSIIVFIIIIVSTLLLAIGCSKQNSEAIDVSEVKEYAEPASEKIFTGISEKNYALFSEDFDQEMSKALTEKQFNAVADQLGQYESSELIGADKSEEYTRAFFKTKFSNLSKDVTFTIVFSGGEEKKVSGLFYK